MVQLRQRDFLAVLRFLTEIYAPGDPAQFPERLVRSLDALIVSEVASYDEMDTAHCTSSDWFSQAGVLTPDLMRDVWPAVMHEHPVLMHNQRAGDLHAHRISEFYSESKLHDLALYREFYGKAGIEDGLCKGIRASGSVVIGCAFHRTRRSFTDRDSLIFDLIGPHIMQAWRARRAMSRIRDQVHAMSNAAEALNLGIVTLTCQGRVDFGNSQSRALLEQFFGARSTGNRRLPDILLRWWREQKKQFARDQVPRPLAPLVVHCGTSRLTIRLVPDANQDLLLLQKECFAPDYDRLEGLGLTVREADVLNWVAKGKTNEEIGSILGISCRTVQKHLEHIFTKLGVETRTAAAAMVRSGSAQA